MWNNESSNTFYILSNSMKQKKTKMSMVWTKLNTEKKCYRIFVNIFKKHKIAKGFDFIKCFYDNIIYVFYI